MKLEGRVLKLGDEIDTDIILPAQYLALPLDKYSKHLMEPVRPDFYKEIEAGDIIFGGHGFGIGSSRGQAIAAIQKNGIKAVVAISFGRIFFRSAINEGLPCINSEEAYTNTDEGDIVQIEMESSTIINKHKKLQFDFTPFPKMLIDILMAGGGVNYYKQQQLHKRS
jgi:3-isopropylmalate/(R)-2-methylmalate dehydratase small subunit